LGELGINAGTIPLQNKYTKTEEVVNGPFLDKVADLLKSECLYGYLDENEVLRSINLNSPGNSGGPVIEGEDILSVDRIGSGELPGQSVYVRYQTRRLKSPDPVLFNGRVGIFVPEGEVPEGEADVDPVKLINWEVSISESLPIDIEVETKVGNTTERARFVGTAWSKTTTSYKTIYGKEVPNDKRTIYKTFAAEAAENLAQAYWEIGRRLQNYIVYTYVDTDYLYDEQGNEIGSTESTYEPQIVIFGRSNLPAVFSATDFVDLPDPQARHLTRYTVQETSTIEGVQRQVKQIWETRLYHLQGQIGAFQKGKNKATAAEVEELFEKMLADNLQLVTFDTETSFSGRATSQERPKQIERAAGYWRQKAGMSGKSGKNAAPERTVTTLAFGNAGSQRVVEYTLPMSPDDTIEGGGNSWRAVPSVAAQRAQAYGKIQNQMRLGHREGLSIQIAPELMPSVPFAPIYVSAAGITGQYRVNGSSWTFDASGIVCSIDAMFWGGAGQE
jgi:hypothetical protein